MSKRTPRRRTKPGAIELPARLSIAHSQELQRTLVARLASGAVLLVDGSRVEEVDTAILQLLASAWRTGAQRGVERGWQGVSQALRDSARLIGIAEMLQFDGHDLVQTRAGSA
jgi:anti-anti-sigma regulatory factor